MRGKRKKTAGGKKVGKPEEEYDMFEHLLLWALRIDMSSIREVLRHIRKHFGDSPPPDTD